MVFPRGRCLGSNEASVRYNTSSQIADRSWHRHVLRMSAASLMLRARATSVKIRAELMRRRCEVIQTRLQACDAVEDVRGNQSILLEGKLPTARSGISVSASRLANLCQQRHDGIRGKEGAEGRWSVLQKGRCHVGSTCTQVNRNEEREVHHYCCG